MQWIKHQPFITVSAILEKDGEFIFGEGNKKKSRRDCGIYQEEDWSRGRIL